MSAPMPPSPPPEGSGPVAPATSGAQPPVPATPATVSAPVPSTSGAVPVAAASSTSGSAGPSTAGAKAPLPPLTGFRASLEHTGLPRGMLTWKPRLPSRNWLIFWSVVGSVSYLYYDDRRKCRLIKADYISRVEQMGKKPMENALGMPRKVTVWAAKWPEDDDADRGARYFRKYVKPYLVAAGIDFTYPKNPIYGSVTRQVRAQILRQRREALGLQDPAVAALNLPVMQDGRTEMQRDADGGVIVVGRASLKEYLEGVRRGWSNGVGEWNWEKEIEEKIKHDGVFESAPEPVAEVQQAVELLSDSAAAAASSAAAKPSGLSGLSFLSRPQPQMPAPSGPTDPAQPPAPPAIPAHMHEAPSPLPPTAPVLLLPFISHLGFRQIPYMIYDFFTEHKRVQAGAEAAYALIMGQTRPFIPAQAQDTTSALLVDSPAAGSADPASPDSQAGTDSAFDTDAERFYKKDFKKLPARIEKARAEYYNRLEERLASVRALANGEREMTDEEKKSAKGPETEQELKDERLKKELRWMGQLEGWEIVKPETPATWNPKWDGWLKVYELSSDTPKTA